ncbi:ParH-like protein [Kitasatospora sp. NPDC049258]|uniref:ParH-like protein n=1 Tax=Kitasatospora sp. NPDC049258 TaxID=3155394 RepID=UPI00343C91EA
MAAAERDGRRLWRRCQQLVADTPLPVPFEIAGFLGALSVQLDRPIELIPLPTGVRAPCGLLISTDRADYIGFPTDTTPLHQQHIVLHEVGHLLCGHRGGLGGGLGAADSGTAGPLFPHLSGELIRRVLGRTVYTDLQEQEAELFASLALHRTSRARPTTPTAPAGEQGPAGRLGSIFDRPARWGPCP